MRETTIEKISAIQIFDSRGNPTIEASVELEGGAKGRASVPSGASTGLFEACELRDCEMDYGGKGVTKAVNNVNQLICEQLRGMRADEQQAIDQAMITLDGTENKSHLGANAILAVSLACAKAAATAHRLPLYRYLGGSAAVTLPMPMMNVLNGGAHAGNNVDIQEFMIMPVGARSFQDVMRICTKIYATLGGILRAHGLSTTVGDEGGYAPDLPDDEEALKLLVEAIEKAGFAPGEDVCIALDAAASEWYKDGKYILPKKKTVFTKDELIDTFGQMVRKYPIISIEDPLGEEDFEGFAKMTAMLGGQVQIVGDDLFVTSAQRLRKGISMHSANAILIKPNQIGTLSETMLAVRLAQKSGYGTILSHRSGETEDSSIADIAVALNAGQIKTGAPARTDRVCKYNRLLAIEHQLGAGALFAAK